MDQCPDVYVHPINLASSALPSESPRFRLALHILCDMRLADLCRSQCIVKVMTRYDGVRGIASLGPRLQESLAMDLETL